MAVGKNFLNHSFIESCIDPPLQYDSQPVSQLYFVEFLIAETRMKSIFFLNHAIQESVSSSVSFYFTFFFRVYY